MSAESHATTLLASVRPTAARKALRALIRDGEDAALLRLRGALGDAIGDVTDAAWREALFDALELVVAPDLDDTESAAESAVTRIHHAA